MYSQVIRRTNAVPLNAAAHRRVIYEKIELQTRAFVAPAETVVVSAYDETGKADACTLAFFMPSSHVPPCVTIAINATAQRKNLKSILASGAFVVGYPDADQIREADYLGVESGYNTDKLKNIGFTTTPGKAVHAPVIDAMKVSLECEVVHTVTVGSHTQITGEIKLIQADKDIVDEKGRVMIEKMNPLIYNEEGLTYHVVGKAVSEAFKPGAVLRRELSK